MLDLRDRCVNLMQTTVSRGEEDSSSKEKEKEKVRSKGLGIGLLLTLATGQGQAMQMPKNAPGQATEHPPVITMTRTAKLFGDLERQLFEAVQKKDAAALDTLLARDFEVRRAEEPGMPEPREDAIRRETSSYTLREYRIGEIAVHSYGTDTAVVSFLCIEDAQEGGNSTGGSRMMVDVWRQEDGVWKLAARYVSASGTKRRVKPTGRE